eukprot:gene5033-5275_t
MQLLENLPHNQRQSLLKQVLRAVQEAKLARNKIQAVWGARVPVLKYSCARSHLDFDVCLQSHGALVKAQAHDLNDASRSTLNSTSLLYMTIFFLQQLTQLPALQQLVPLEQLKDQQCRLLQEEADDGVGGEGDLLLALAVQQSSEEWIKGLRQDIRQTQGQVWSF